MIQLGRISIDWESAFSNFHSFIDAWAIFWNDIRRKINFADSLCDHFILKKYGKCWKIQYVLVKKLRGYQDQRDGIIKNQWTLLLITNLRQRYQWGINSIQIADLQLKKWILKSHFEKWKQRFIYIKARQVSIARKSNLKLKAKVWRHIIYQYMQRVRLKILCLECETRLSEVNSQVLVRYFILWRKKIQALNSIAIKGKKFHTIRIYAMYVSLWKKKKDKRLDMAKKECLIDLQSQRNILRRFFCNWCHQSNSYEEQMEMAKEFEKSRLFWRIISFVFETWKSKSNLLQRMNNISSFVYERNMTQNFFKVWLTNTKIRHKMKSLRIIEEGIQRNQRERFFSGSNTY